MGAAALAAAIWLNRKFYLFLAAKRGWFFLAGALPLHLPTISTARWRLPWASSCTCWSGAGKLAGSTHLRHGRVNQWVGQETPT